MNDRAIAVVLAGLVLLARLPFTAGTLWAWDSVLYARALEQGFHVGAELIDQRPHPPGYVFYVMTAAAARIIAGDSNAALVTLSVVASALSAAALYLLCRRWSERGISLACALGFAVAPLAWTHGEVAMPYAVLGLLSTAIAGFFAAARGRGLRSISLASIAFGVAAGFRQDLILIAGPLWLWMLFPAGWRDRAVASLALAASCLAWALPTAFLSGGPAAYAASLTGQMTRVSEMSPGSGDAASLGRNVLLSAYGLWWGLLGFAILLPASLVARSRLRWRADGGALFFALWIAPAALVYLAVHIGDPGYLMSILPALYAGTAALLGGLAAGQRRVAMGTVALLAVGSGAVFLASSAPYSREAIAQHDRSVRERVASVRARYAPVDSVVLAQFEYLTARYYLPEYRVLFRGDAPQALSRSAREIRISAPTSIVVFGPLADPPPTDPNTVTIAYDVEPR